MFIYFGARDLYIYVIEENIEPTYYARVQYEKCTTCTASGPYECNSIMHYKQGGYGVEFGNTTLDTMEPIATNCTEFGNNEPTEHDWIGLRHRLECNCENDFENTDDENNTVQ